MGKTIYLINATFGIIFGLAIGAFGLIQLSRGYTVEGAGAVIGALIAIAFAIYEIKKYKTAKKAQ